MTRGVEGWVIVASNTGRNHPARAARFWILALVAWIVLRPAWAVDAVDLTAAERRWMAEHPVVTIGVSPELPPYCFTDPGQHRAYGFAVELVDLFARRTGLRFDYRVYPRAAAADQALRRNEIDLTLLTVATDERRDAVRFTRPLFTPNLVLVARRDVPDISPTGAFAGRLVAVESDSPAQEMLRRERPDAKVRAFEQAGEALQAVASGQADLYIGLQHVAVYRIEKELLANLELRASLGPGSVNFGPAVRRGLPELQSILNKAIASVTAADRSQLAERWLPAGATLPVPAEQLVLSAAERDWVARQGRVRVGYDPSFAPFTLRGDFGDFRGLGADVLRLMLGKVGLEIETEIGRPFADLYDQGKAGALDVIVGMARTPQRRLDYDFVGPFTRVPTALFTRRQDGLLVSDTSEIGNRKLALLRAHFLLPELRSRHPGLSIVELDRQDQVLAAVAQGAADVGLGNLKVVNELIERRFVGEIGITGVVRGGESELYIGVPRQMPELTRVLQRSFESLSAGEVAAIESRWLLVTVTPGVRWTTVLQVALPITLGVAIYLALLLRGNRRLRRARQIERDARHLAEASTQARGRFLAYLSHELRGGLAGIRAGVELLRERDDDPRLRERMLGTIADATHGLGHVLESTLAYEQTAANAVDYDPRPTDLDDWWQQTAAPGVMAAERKGLNFAARWHGPPARRAIDRTRLQQVVQNLMHNAIKFTPARQLTADGHVSAVPGEVRLDAGLRTRDGADWLTLEVHDTGPGIGPEERDTLFQPYAQGAAGRSARSGAGLGLAIAQQLVAGMGGHIELESRPGAGATFRVAVPVTAE